MSLLCMSFKQCSFTSCFCILSADTQYLSRAIADIERAFHAQNANCRHVTFACCFSSCARAHAQPCVHMVLIARRLLDEIDDVELVSSLTSLVLGVAESLSRLRIAANRSLTELAFNADDDDVSIAASQYDNFWSYVDDLRPTGSADRSAVAVTNESVLDAYDEAGASVGLPLASMEICDAAYRQIQVLAERIQDGRLVIV